MKVCLHVEHAKMHETVLLIERSKSRMPAGEGVADRTRNADIAMGCGAVRDERLQLNLSGVALLRLARSVAIIVVRSCTRSRRV